MNIAVIISHYTSFLMNVIIESSSAQLVRFHFWVDRLINATLMIAEPINPTEGEGLWGPQVPCVVPACKPEKAALPGGRGSQEKATRARARMPGLENERLDFNLLCLF